MILKRIILANLILFQMTAFFGQSVAYLYDASGNRINRTIVVQLLKENVVTFPVVALESLNSSDIKGTGGTQTIQSEISSEDVRVRKSDELAKTSDENNTVTIVYPNPTTGILKINITNMPLGAATEMKLYDFGGTEILIKRNFESYSEIDISQVKDGVYILRIKISDKIFDWKVIKHLP